MAVKSKKPRTKGIQQVSSKLIYAGPAFSVYRDFVREGEFTIGVSWRMVEQLNPL